MLHGLHEGRRRVATDVRGVVWDVHRRDRIRLPGRIEGAGSQGNRAAAVGDPTQEGAAAQEEADRAGQIAAPAVKLTLAVNVTEFPATTGLGVDWVIVTLVEAWFTVCNMLLLLSLKLVSPL